MSSGPAKIKQNIDIETVDIPTMYAMSDNEYRQYVRSDGLVYVDHHDILRSAVAGYPLATTLEQLDILMEELHTLRNKMVPRPK